MRAITADWEGRQAAERETRHAYNDRNAVQRLFLEPAPQRTSRADKLMERLRVDERGVSERQGNVDIPTPREPSRTTWMRKQYLAADRTEHEIRAERRLNSPTSLSPTAVPYYPGWTRL